MSRIGTGFEIDAQFRKQMPRYHAVDAWNRDEQFHLTGIRLHRFGHSLFERYHLFCQELIVLVNAIRAWNGGNR